jgi:hypothetical protein
VPETALGLPVLTVAAAQALIDSGAVDGRFMAVGGYWYQFALPCAYQPHIAPLADHCGYGELFDTRQNPNPGSSDGLSPAFVAESAASFGGVPNGAPVVVLMHVADARLWQCPGDQRADCKARPVLDRMVWADGQEVDPTQFQPDLVTTTSYDAAIAAATESGMGPAVLAYPLDASRLQDVDPRFSGSTNGLVWYVRVNSGAPFSNDVAPGIDVLIDDETGELLSFLTQEINMDDLRARVVLDSNGWIPAGDARPRYVLANGPLWDSGWPTANYLEGWLDSSSAPLALTGRAGDPEPYTVHAYIGTETTGLPDGPSCDLSLDLRPGDDVAYYADFPMSGDCVWKQGSWPFN